MPWREGSLGSLLRRTRTLSHQGPTLGTSFNLSHLLISSSLRTVTVGVRILGVGEPNSAQSRWALAGPATRSPDTRSGGGVLGVEAVMCDPFVPIAVKIHQWRLN